MPTEPLTADNSWVTESPDQPRVPAELVFLAVVLMLTVIFAIAGIPGAADPVATEGSDALRQGWLEKHNQAHAATAIAEPAAPVERSAPQQPAGR